jgi:rubrerythrin
VYEPDPDAGTVEGTTGTVTPSEDGTDGLSYCPACGTDLSRYEAAKFCPACGTELN